MTVSSTTNTASYGGNSITTAFAIPFYFQNVADIVVNQYNTSSMVTTPLTYTSGTPGAGQFTISPATDPDFGWPMGGTVTVGVATPSGTNLNILREVQPLQPLDLPVSGPMPSQPLERELDKLAMTIQDYTNYGPGGAAAASATAAAASALAAAGSATAAAASATAAAESAAEVGNQWSGTSGGTASAMTITPPTTVPAYVAGLQFQFIAGTTSTGATTLAVSGLSAQTILDQAGNPLIAGSITTGLTYSVVYNGTNFVINELATLPPNSVNTTQMINGAVTLAKLAAAVAQALVPTGTILSYGGGTTPPAGYLYCDGTSYLRATYPALFTAIGTSCGTADSTHFNVPDLRGRFLRAYDDGTGRDPDASSRTAMNAGGSTGALPGTIQGSQFGNHQHQSSGNVVAGYGPNNPGAGGGFAGVGGGTVGTNYQGGNETRPINAYVTYIIKT